MISKSLVYGFLGHLKFAWVLHRHYYPARLHAAESLSELQHMVSQLVTMCGLES